MDEFRRTVENGLDIDESAPSALQDYERVRIWGTESSQATQGGGGIKRTAFRNMESDDILLFYSEGEFFASARVEQKFENPDIGEWAWNSPESDWTYTLQDFDSISVPKEEVWDLLGYSQNYRLQGLTQVSEDAIDTLLTKYNSVEEAYQDLIDGSQTDRGDEEVIEEGTSSSRDHLEIQWKLIQLGRDHGYEVYVAKNDRNREFEGEVLGNDCVNSLSLTGFSEAAQNIIEYVDVIWLEDNHIVSMFEVESTTSIYSGILRMTDFVAKVPNLAVDMYIVASQEDEDLVRKQIQRPTFQQVLTPADYSDVRFVSFEKVREKYDLVQNAGPLQRVFP
ncbi:hypothetical protein [Halorhabdus utahensis]|nr:hypothetical protein [Halorhabdus utahensis]